MESCTRTQKKINPRDRVTATDDCANKEQTLKKKSPIHKDTFITLIYNL